MPAADLAFGVGRFQDYANPANVAAIGGARPFILNQPILSVDDPQFDAALDAALLARSAVLKHWRAGRSFGILDGGIIPDCLRCWT